MRAVLIVPGWQAEALEHARALLSAWADLGPAHLVLLGQSQAYEETGLETLPCAEITRLTGGFGDTVSSEAMVRILLEHLPRGDAYLFPGNLIGTELCVRAGCALDAPVLTDVRRLTKTQAALEVIRGAYSQNLYAAFDITRFPCALSVASGAFAPSQETGRPRITQIPCRVRQDAAVKVDMQRQALRLDNTPRLVVGGRGAGREGLALLDVLAQALDAQLGVTRPVSADGLAPHDRVVGVSGTVTRPEVALVFGASGAAPFLTGIRGAKLIIAVNKDEKAPIFSACDVGVAGDLKTIAKTLLECLKESGHA
ncbi:MAG: electron transfer flavoprotein subunit alpha/FixB family protein [Christensenellales bacterium]|jgi:electron transfer flavoprotein alpha subunit